ncbi:MAG: NAD-binding protein, partial [Gemmatimonadetes bacterium]|nr:NAD-binding protein [Gemmatimonadota bacterium]
VTILHRGKRPPEGFDPDLVDMLCHRTRSLGIDLHLTTEATAVEEEDGRLRVIARAGGEERRLPADLAVRGRAPVPRKISTSRRRASSATNAGWR